MLNRLCRATTLGIAAVAVFAVLAAPHANAAESIADYNVDVTLTPEAVMEVVETISYDFADQADRHGIQRDLVVEEALSDGGTQSYDVSVTGVTADGVPVAFSSTESGGFLSVRIGDPDVTVSGIIDYQVSYSVTGAVRAIAAAEVTPDNGLAAGDIELYWDLIGDGWSVPISTASASISGPAAPVAAACYFGPAGADSSCPIFLEDDHLVVEPLSLGAGEALTAVAAYPSSAFTNVPEPRIEPPFVIPAFAWFISLALSLIALLVPIALVLINRRDLRGRALDGSPVQFEPPDSVRPAQLQAALHGDVDARGAVATMLDLTARGYLTLSADDGGLLQADSITITRTSKPLDELSPWENSFITRMMGGLTQKTVSGYDASLASALAETSETLVAEAQQTGRRSTTRNQGLRSALVIIGILALVLGFVALFTMPHGSGILALIPGALLLVSCLIAARLVPARESDKSATFQSQAQGFRKLLDTDAAEARREFAQRSGLQPFAIFATMLPYAVIFDLAESWTQAFPEITTEQLNDAGFFVGSTWAMYAFINSAEASVVMAATEPSRDSGSGFSGGFSGGGGGGGGGGSW